MPSKSTLWYFSTLPRVWYDLRVWKCLWRLPLENLMTAWLSCGWMRPNASMRFLEKAQLVAISGTGAGGGGIWGVAFQSMSPSLAHRLSPTTSGERAREIGHCGSGSVNAADSRRRFPGYQRRKAPSGLSLSCFRVPSAGNAKREQSGVKASRL